MAKIKITHVISKAFHNISIRKVRALEFDSSTIQDGDMNILRYELSDDKIKLGIEALFAHMKEINTSHVTVRVDHGFVTLAGTVKTQKDKEILASQLNLIDGVTDFENRLIVKMPKKNLPISVKSSTEAQD